MKGICGSMTPPAFIATKGMSAAFSATRVKSAGVGLPSGVIGMASMHLQRP